MKEINSLDNIFADFKRLLLIALGKRDCFDSPISAKRWEQLFAESEKQSLSGVMLSGIEKLPMHQMPPHCLLLEWIGTANYIEMVNTQQCDQIREISETFNKVGIRTCLLKGQSAASLYPNSYRRQSGDIDLWVDCGRRNAIKYCQEKWGTDHIDVKNLIVKSIPNVYLEVHFMPSIFYNPLTGRKFRKWYGQQMETQFSNRSEKGFCMPTIEFSLVYCLIHIYRHQFDEGIGLRQLMDYYYVLMNSKEEERKKALVTLSELGMARFCGAVMFVMRDFFDIDECHLLSEPDERLGKKLAADIQRGGNFGHYDERNAHGEENRWQRGLRNIRHNYMLLLDYPSEVLWSPIWKCWHWLWRKTHGYL